MNLKTKTEFLKDLKRHLNQAIVLKLGMLVSRILNLLGAMLATTLAVYISFSGNYSHSLVSFLVNSILVWVGAHALFTMLEGTYESGNYEALENMKHNKPLNYYLEQWNLYNQNHFTNEKQQ